MVPKLLTLLVVVFTLSVAFAQAPAVPPALGYADTYQIQYLPTVVAGNNVNILNAGTHTEVYPPPLLAPLIPAPTGVICADVYVYDPDEQPRNCCTCPISQNAVRHLTGADLAPTAFTSPPSPPFNNFTVKIVFTRPATSLVGAAGSTPQNLALTGACNAAIAVPDNVLAPVAPVPTPMPGPASATKQFAAGGVAEATKWHVFEAPALGQLTEVKFTKVPLAPVEYQKLVTNCRFIVTGGSGAGICASCAIGALSAPGGTGATAEN